MAGEWREATLIDLIAIQRGHDLTETERHPGTVPVFGSAGQNGFHDKALAPGPGVVIGRSGASFGRISFCEVPYWPHNTTLYVTDFKGNDPRFVYYCLSAMDFSHYNSGSAQQSLNRNYIYSAQLLIPDMDSQRVIARILGALDDKIELNRRMNETLEAMAWAIFRDWFVDFGPTRAKMEGRAPYLAPDLWPLFPDHLDPDGKPEGWKIVPLSELIEVNPPEQLARGRPAPYLDMASIPTAGPNPEPFVVREFGSGMRFRNGDALLARITPCLENGKTAFVQNLPKDEVGWGSTEFIVLRSRPPIPRALAYLVARDPAFRANAIRSMTGTSGRQRASAGAISAYCLTHPGNDSLWVFLSRVIAPLFERVAANDRESHTLAATRDLLLPKLMSGEVRVKNVEKLVGEIA